MSAERDASRVEEREAVLAVYPDAAYDEKASKLSIPIGDPSKGVTLNVIYPPDHPYPSPSTSPPRAPPMYITSESRKVPPYIRLHLLSRVLVELYGLSADSRDSEHSHLKTELEAGGQVLFSCVEILETHWSELLRDKEGTHHPDVSEVMKHLLPPPRPPSPPPPGEASSTSASFGKTKRNNTVVDPRSDDQVLRDLEQARKDRKKYDEVMAQRMKLPAWDAREKIVDLVKNNRVLVVVGETGCGKTTQRTSIRPFSTACPLSPARGRSRNKADSELRFSSLPVSSPIHPRLPRRLRPRETH